MSRALTKRLREIGVTAKHVVGDLGYAKRPLSIFQSSGRKAVWIQPVDFREREFTVRTRREVAELILDRVKDGVIAAIQEIRERHGNPTYGFEVRGPYALKDQEGWTPEMGDYRLSLVWIAPAYETPMWPHPIPTVEEPVALGTDADEAAFCGLDLVDYRRVTDPDPEVRAKVGPPKEIVPDEPNGL